MTPARSTALDTCSAMLAGLVGLLAHLGCNAILGIEEPTCVGACGGGVLPGTPDGGALPRERTFPRVLPGDAGARPPRTGALGGAGDAGLASDAGAPPCDRAGSCIDPACLPEQRRCAGAELQVCDAARAAFVLEEQCASAALCDAASAACQQPLCTPEQRRCEGARLEACSGDATGFVLEEQCASPGLCDPEGCQAPACVTGERRCSADVLEQMQH